jgi:hypothetical protein
MKTKKSRFAQIKAFFIRILSGRSKQFNCYEIWRPNIPADGCKTQCKECAERDNQLNCR